MSWSFAELLALMISVQLNLGDDDGEESEEEVEEVVAVKASRSARLRR